MTRIGLILCCIVHLVVADPDLGLIPPTDQPTEPAATIDPPPQAPDSEYRYKLDVIRSSPGLGKFVKALFRRYSEVDGRPPKDGDPSIGDTVQDPKDPEADQEIYKPVLPGDDEAYGHEAHPPVPEQGRPEGPQALSLRGTMTLPEESAESFQTPFIADEDIPQLAAHIKGQNSVKDLSADQIRKMNFPFRLAAEGHKAYDYEETESDLASSAPAEVDYNQIQGLAKIGGVEDYNVTGAELHMLARLEAQKKPSPKKVGLKLMQDGTIDRSGLSQFEGERDATLSVESTMVLFEARRRRKDFPLPKSEMPKVQPQVLAGSTDTSEKEFYAEAHLLDGGKEQWHAPDVDWRNHTGHLNQDFIQRAFPDSLKMRYYTNQYAGKTNAGWAYGATLDSVAAMVMNTDPHLPDLRVGSSIIWPADLLEEAASLNDDFLPVTYYGSHAKTFGDRIRIQSSIRRIRTHKLFAKSPTARSLGIATPAVTEEDIRIVNEYSDRILKPLLDLRAEAIKDLAGDNETLIEILSSSNGELVGNHEGPIRSKMHYKIGSGFTNSPIKGKQYWRTLFHKPLDDEARSKPNVYRMPPKIRRLQPDIVRLEEVGGESIGSIDMFDRPNFFQSPLEVIKGVKSRSVHLADAADPVQALLDRAQTHRTRAVGTRKAYLERTAKRHSEQVKELGKAKKPANITVRAAELAAADGSQDEEFVSGGNYYHKYSGKRMETLARPVELTQTGPARDGGIKCVKFDSFPAYNKNIPHYWSCRRQDNLDIFSPDTVRRWGNSKAALRLRFQFPNWHKYRLRWHYHFPTDKWEYNVRDLKH